MVICGWDVSTSAIGICIRRDGVPDRLEVIFPRGKTPLEKYRDVYWRLTEYMERLFIEEILTDIKGPVYHYVEDRLGGFSGVTTKQTLMALAAMNAVASLALSMSGTVTHIPPVTTKRITGLKVDKAAGETKKHAVVKLARQMCPTFPYVETAAGNWVKGTDDMADAWLLAEAGSKILSGEETLGPKKKTAGHKGEARRAKGQKG